MLRSELCVRCVGVRAVCAPQNELVCACTKRACVCVCARRMCARVRQASVCARPPAHRRSRRARSCRPAGSRRGAAPLPRASSRRRRRRDATAPNGGGDSRWKGGRA
eukprot:4732853-Pleurochrysis_carterae.AAC.1